MSRFSCIVTPNSIAFVTPHGKTINVTDAHLAFEEMKDTIKALQAALRAGNDAEADTLHHKLAELAEPAKRIIEAGEGRVVVIDGEVLFDGEPINNAVTRRIIWGLKEGFDMLPYIRFLDNLMENPSKRAVDELYGFMEANNLGITDDGYLIAYKRVREDYLDIYSGKIDHSVGQKPSMARNKVDDDKDRTCSYGFHFCSMSYLPHYGAGPGNRIVIVKVHPRDVVSIPSDYNNAKARCCTYEVIGEYNGSDKDDILATKPIWSQSDWGSSDDDEAENDWEYDSEEDEEDESEEDGYADESDEDDDFSSDYSFAVTDENDIEAKFAPDLTDEERRVFSVEIGDMPVETAKAAVEEFVEQHQSQPKTMLDEVAAQVLESDMRAAKESKATGAPVAAAFIIGPDGNLVPVFGAPLVPRYDR